MYSKRSKTPDARSLPRLIAAAFLVFCLGLPALAADPVQDPAPWDAWTKRADTAREAVDAGAASEEALAELRKNLEDQRDAAANVAKIAGEDLKRLEEQLAALGPPPDEGVEEAPDAAALRADLTEKTAAAKARQGRAQSVVTRFETLLADLAALSQRRFLDRMEAQGPSPINPGAWLKARDALYDIYGRIQREVDRALESPSARENFYSRAPLALIVFGAGVFLLFGLRGLALGFFMREAGRETGRGRRLILGLGATTAQVMTVALAAGLLLYALAQADVLGLTGDAAVRGLGRGLFILIIAYALAAALFSPQSSILRISSLRDDEAHGAFRATLWLAAALALHSVLNAVAAAAAVSAKAEAVYAFVTVSAAALALYALARALGPPIERAATGDGALGAQVARLLRRAALTAAIMAPVLAALGYSFAAKFILFPTARSLGVIAGAYLLFLLIRETVDVYLESAEREGEKRGRVRLLPIFAGFLLISVALPLLALVWGAEPADLAAAYDMAAAGLTIGDVVLSPMDFVIFAMVFGLGYTITRMAQRVLSGTVLPQTGMSAGGASALTAGVGYIGVFLAALAAISATGIDLSNLAIVAGALSVGVGFGLQNIVNNFVSGVILLVERPIKVGDWIEAGGAEGYVKRVNVRSTEIQTFDRASFIIPNSDLIAGNVLNWTHSDMTGRVRVPVGVAYGTDPRRVEKLLLELGRAHPMVIASPAPVVYFLNFGADALEFELRVYLRDVNWMLSVKSDLNFAIAERFAREGVEIPFAQRDLHIRDPEALGKALRGEP